MHTVAENHRRGFQRLFALTAVYVLALQALFAGGAQIKLLLVQTPGICTLLGLEDAEKPAHAADACGQHCVAHASLDAGKALSVAAILISILVWRQFALRPDLAPVRPVLGFRGRGPPPR